VAVGGFGDGHNSYAYGYAWFQDHVYVGTNRDILVLAKTRLKYTVPTEVWPIDLPDPKAYRDPDPGGQIWRYNPRTDVWQRVYFSPIVTGVDGADTPISTGFRNLVVFQGKSDPAPALYTIPSCGSTGLGVVMLRCADGQHFEQISDFGMGLTDRNITAFRSLVTFKGRLFMTPAGSRGGDPNVSYHAAILCSDDPVSGRWQVTNPSSFGDPANYGIYDMCVSGDWLYAGTMNIREGCQLWKTRAEGEPPFEWIKVFDRGADRGPFNQGVVCLTAFQGDVYCGTGIQNGGYDRVNNIGPGAAEIIRARPDDTWDIVVGDPRMTSQGFKIPISGYGAGFNNPFAGYMWRMCTHEGILYVGTYDGSAMFRFNGLDPRARRIFDPDTMDAFMQARGGCELWRTHNGEHWEPVTRNGFGSGYNWGIRTLLSTPHGLFVGTANPFGPEVAVRGAGGWRYKYNPRGGVEVWHGDWSHAGIEGSATREEIPSAIATAFPAKAKLTAEEPVQSLPEIPLDPSLPAATAELIANPSQAADHQIWAGLWEELPIGPPWTTRRWHAIRNRERLERSIDAHDPIARLGEIDKRHAPVPAEIQAEVDSFFAATKMRNVGYWSARVRTPTEACDSLVEELVALFDLRRSVDDPTPLGAPLSTGARVLVVGQGTGAIAAQVWRWRPDFELELLEQPASGLSHFDYSTATFDAVLWMEGPSRHNRQAALAEAFRVTKPAGWLVASDLFGQPRDRLGIDLNQPWDVQVSLQNYYQDLSQNGWKTARVIDATHLGWVRFSRSSHEHFAAKNLFHHLDDDGYRAALAALPGGDMLVEANLLLTAVKTAQPEPTVIPTSP